MEANEKSGDPQFDVIQQLEKWTKARMIAIILLVAALLVEIGLIWPGAMLSLCLHLLGLGACLALFLKGLGVDTLISQAVCRQGRRADCNNVIQSPIGKLFGTIQISELGLLFFGGCMLGEVLTLLAIDRQNLMVGYFCLGAIPITLFLIFYQGVILKAWCFFCLCVSAVIWILGGAHLGGPIVDWPNFQEQLMLLSGFGVSVLLWLTIRSQVIAASQSTQQQAVLGKFRRSRELYNALLNSQPSVDPEVSENDVVVGKEDAVITVTLVTSPTCGPCVMAHEAFDELYRNFPDKIRLVYRFAVNSRENWSVANRVSLEIVNLGILSINTLPEAIRSWYSRSRPPMDEWMKIHALPKVEQTTSAINKHEMWCRLNGIKSTPTIFIQGRRTPDLFQVADV